MSVEAQTGIQEANDEYFSQLHERIVDHLVNGKMHSTIVGITIVLDGDKSKNDFIEAKRFADYFIDLLKKMS